MDATWLRKKTKRTPVAEWLEHAKDITIKLSRYASPRVFNGPPRTVGTFPSNPAFRARPANVFHNTRSHHNNKIILLNHAKVMSNCKHIFARKLLVYDCVHNLLCLRLLTGGGNCQYNPSHEWVMKDG